MAALTSALLLAAPFAIDATEMPGALSVPTEQRYAIAAQPLAAALALYARVSGVDVFYETTLGTNRISSPVDGLLSRQAALRTLLIGTGLSARFTRPKAAIVYLTAGPRTTAGASAPSASATRNLPELRLDMAEVRAPMMIGAEDRSGYQRYALAAQFALRRMLTDDAAMRGQAFRLQVSLVVSPKGRIDRVSLLHGSGDTDRDRHVRRILTGRTLAPPPEGLRDALVFEVATAPPAIGD